MKLKRKLVAEEQGSRGGEVALLALELGTAPPAGAFKKVSRYASFKPRPSGAGFGFCRSVLLSVQLGRGSMV